MSTRRPDREGVGCGRNKFRKVVTVFLDRATVDGLVCWTGGDEMLFRVLDFPFFLRKKEPCAMRKLLKTIGFLRNPGACRHLLARASP